jgi:uncharacterized protein (DUF433 family)
VQDERFVEAVAHAIVFSARNARRRTTISIDPIVLDDKGVARVAGTRSRVSQIVCDVRNHLTPEQIHESYPHLSLAQVHAALSYYYDHKQEIDVEIDEGIRLADELRTQAMPGASRAELRNRIR